MPEKEWIVVRNTHEAIIKEEVFDAVGRKMHAFGKMPASGKIDEVVRKQTKIQEEKNDEKENVGNAVCDDDAGWLRR